MWHTELAAWAPREIFDAHVHLGPPGIAAPFTPERLTEALSTFTHLTYEQAHTFYREGLSGKHMAGMIAFGFPLREIDLKKANEYIAETARRHPEVRPFILADPHDIPGTIDQFHAIRDRGVRFLGVKPYFDLLRLPVKNSVFHCQDIDFTPPELLEFMNKESLALMLHTSSIGGGDPKVRGFVRMAATTFPRVKIILAHMSRYTRPEQFKDLFHSDVLDLPNVFLEMSSASSAEVYSLTLSRPDLWDRLVFGTDIPFGLLTGTEHWSDTHGPVFITRDDYTWSDPQLQARFADVRQRMTYNTYHCIKALKDAITGMKLTAAMEDDLKQRIFSRNALERLLVP